MKKIILFGLVLVMVFAVSGVVNGQAGGCGPTPLGSLGCLPTTISCGFTQCLGEYTTLDETASGVCEGCVEVCIPPYCDPNEVCFTPYKGSIEMSVTTANDLQTGIIDGGDFSSDIPCGEMNHCFLNVGSLQIGSLPMLDKCSGSINPETYAQTIEGYAKEFGIDLGNNIPLDKLTQQVVWDAATKYGLELPIVKQTLANAIMLAKNTWGAIKPFVDFFDNPIFKIFSLAKTGYDLISGLTGGAEQAASDAANLAAAKNDIDDADNSNPDGTATLSDCKNHRLDDCVNHPSCVIDSRGGSLQCLAALPGGKDGRVKVTFGSLHVIDRRLNNMFTLTGKQNQGVVYQKDGFVNIDKGGTTKISVAGEGAFITDINNNQLYIGPGTTFYYGKGDSEEDTYVTNAMILDYDSRIGVADVNAKEQQNYPKNTEKNLKQNIELAVTFNQHGLQGYKNAVNIEKSKESYEILTRGFSDILLLEEEKVFPLVTRNYAKGDASVIMHRNVKIPNTYIVNDETYEYTIKTIGDSTKVITKNGKVIEDSGSFDTRLSRRQNILVNNI